MLFSIYFSFFIFHGPKHIYLIVNWRKSRKYIFLSSYLIQYLWWNWEKKILF